MRELIDKLYKEHRLKKEEYLLLLTKATKEDKEYLAMKAREVREKYYGKSVFIRGLIEVGNYCKNDCYYCGIRRGNKNCERYRLTPEDIL